MSEVLEGWCEPGWSVTWKMTDYERVIVPEARLVVLDPRVRDWRRAVDDAMEHVRSLERAPLRLVPNDLMGEM